VGFHRELSPALSGRKKAFRSTLRTLEPMGLLNLVDLYDLLWSTDDNLPHSGPPAILRHIALAQPGPPQMSIAISIRSSAVHELGRRGRGDQPNVRFDFATAELDCTELAGGLLSAQQKIYLTPPDSSQKSKMGRMALAIRLHLTLRH